MKLIISEAEVRQMIAEQLSEKFGGKLILPEELTPIYKTEGEFEDAVTEQAGYELSDSAMAKLLSIWKN